MTRVERAILVGCVLVGMMLGAAVGRRLGAGWLARDLLSVLGVPVGYLAGLCLVKYLRRRAHMRKGEEDRAGDRKQETGHERRMP